MRGIASLTVAVLVAIGAGVGIEAGTTSSTAATTVVSADCAGGSVRPTSIVLACADANAVATHLKWTTWGAEKAVAVGSLSQNDCNPYCAAGHFVDYPADFVLSEPVVAGGKSFLTRITIIFAGRSPNGRASELAQACWENPPKASFPRCPADLVKAEGS